MDGMEDALNLKNNTGIIEASPTPEAAAPADVEMAEDVEMTEEAQAEAEEAEEEAEEAEEEEDDDDEVDTLFFQKFKSARISQNCYQSVYYYFPSKFCTKTG